MAIVAAATLLLPRRTAAGHAAGQVAAGQVPAGQAAAAPVRAQVTAAAD